MKWIKWVCVFLIGLAAVQTAHAREGGARPVQVVNRLRIEYDDNIYQEETDKNASLKIIEEVELRVNFNFDKAYVGLRYRPSYAFWENRTPDRHDFNHDLDFILNLKFTPKLTLSVLETLRRGELPELVDGNVLVRERDDFWYNTLNTTLGYRFLPQTRLDIAGRYVLLRYDDSRVSDTEDFDLYVGGLTLRHQLVQQTTLLGEFRAEQVAYEGPDRGSKSVFVGLGVEQMFTPNLVGSARGGYQRKDFNSDEIGTANAPYADLALTFLPSPATRFTLGAGYSMFESDMYPFSSQDRTQVFGSFAYDITARIAFYLSAAYTLGSYDSDQALHQDDEDEQWHVKSGDDAYAQVSARFTFKLGRRNWLETGWQYVNFDSGVQRADGEEYRMSYDRNRVDIGWKILF